MGPHRVNEIIFKKIKNNKFKFTAEQRFSNTSEFFECGENKK